MNSYKIVLLYLSVICTSVSFFSLSALSEYEDNALNLEIKNIEDQFIGQKVKKISFFHASKLTYDELSSLISVKLGDNLKKDSLLTSSSSLLSHGNFSNVDIQASSFKNGVFVKFTLQLKKIISDVSFSGARSFGYDTLESFGARIKGKKLTDKELKLFKGRVITLLNDRGFLDASAEISVKTEENSHHSSVNVKIDTGEKARIKEILLPADLPEDLIETIEREQKIALSKAASKENIENLRKSFLQACRSEGYLQASVPEPGIVVANGQNDVSLNFSIISGLPLSLIFEGNKEFSPEELLAPLKLKTRSVPFGPSAIQNLVKEIKLIYQSEGYFNISVNSSRIEDQGKRKRYLIEINEGVRYESTPPEFKGNKFASDSELFSLFKSFSSQGVLAKIFFRKKIVKEYIEAEIGNVIDFYRKNGFLDIEAKLDQFIEGEKLKSIVLIDEGKRYHVKSITSKKDSASLSDEYKLPEPNLITPFSYSSEKLEKEIIRLSSILQNSGFPASQIDVEYDRETEDLKLLFNLGPRVKIGKISIEGNFHTKNKVVQRALKFKTGDRLNSEQIRLSQQNLYKLGYFRNVQITPSDGALDNKVEDLTVLVNELDTANIKAGIGFHSEDGLRVLSELRQGNLFGTGNTATIGFDAYFNEEPRIVDAGNARALYRVPNLNGTPLELKLEGFFRFQIQQIEQFSYDRAGASVGLEYPVTEKISLASSFLAYSEDVFDVDDSVNISDNDSGTSFYNFFNFNVNFDFRDNPYLPSSGGRTIIALRVTDDTIGSDISFTDISLRQSYFKRITDNLVWANSFKAQLISPFSDTEIIPLSQRIFLGGRNSLRGFSLASVGPKFDDGLALGGDNNLLINSELQLDLTENITAVVFLDAGRAFLDNSSFPESGNLIQSKFRYSPGLGIRYKTPIGPISFDYGFATKREDGEDFGRINLGIGLIF